MLAFVIGWPIETATDSTVAGNVGTNTISPRGTVAYCGLDEETDVDGIVVVAVGTEDVGVVVEAADGEVGDARGEVDAVPEGDMSGMNNALSYNRATAAAVPAPKTPLWSLPILTPSCTKPA